jgi:PH/SEC7 domain-containing protein
MRPQLPPTAYPSGLQPVASGDMNGNRPIHRRISRTDLDFEQALRAEGTVMLKEGLDVNSLGLDSSPSPMNASFGSPSPSRQVTPRVLQPSTPTVVPPTPTPVAGPSSTRTPASSASASQSSSSHDVFYDAEETTERQTNRRSMYRSPGTSSSPDLATLLRKAKEKGGVVGAHHKREKRRESPPPPLPTSYDRPSSSGRQRSSTSYSSNPSSPQITPLSKGKLRGAVGESSPEWVLPSPRPKEHGSTKVSIRFTSCRMILSVLRRQNRR